MRPLSPALEARQSQASEISEMKNRAKDYVGDKLRIKKHKDVTRLILSNVAGMTGGTGTEKVEELKVQSLKFNPDITMITEVGQNERRIQSTQTLRERTKGWWEATAVRTAYNRHYDSGTQRQFGGVAILAQGKLAHRISATEQDPTGLGRWTSVLISGKRNTKTRIITAYRPSNGKSPGSVNMQHHLHFYKSQGDTDAPRKKFIDDLTDQIIKWKSQGELIILGGDMNTGDRNSADSLQRFWAPFVEATGLVDAHKKHLSNTWLPPTCERGSVQIDFMFISPGIRIYRAGFLPFGKYPGDHRAIWIELVTEDILGTNPEPLRKPEARRLKLQDPRIVKRYQEKLVQFVQASKIDTAIHELERKAEQEWTEKDEIHYNTIATQYRKYMLQAEKACRNLKMGVHQWSPEFARARSTKFFWEMALKHKKGISIPTKKFLKLKKKLKIKHSHKTLQELVTLVKQAKIEYRKVKRKSRTLRQTFIENLVEAIAEEKNTKKESEMKALANREQLKETFRKIKVARKANGNTALTSIKVTKDDGSKRVIVEKQEIEEALLNENLMKFRQTTGQCPLMKGTLRKHFGTTATNQQSDKVIQGTYSPPSRCRKSTKAFLDACKQPESFHPAPHNHLSLEQYRASWKSAKERTSSGIAHFGLWKAGAEHPVLGELEWKLSTIPGKFGFAPDVWKTATDVMLLKKEGLTDIEKLRTIVLYEADYNFMNKRIGRQAMDNAMYNGLIAEEQFAKPKSDSTTQCVNRKLIFDLVRYARASFAMCSSDLKSCYDRIVHSAASLAMQKMGISRNQARSMFLTIQQCNHKVRTSFGDSEKTYGNQEEKGEPLLGVGQGNGAGPTIWAIISSVLFQAMHAEGFKVEFAAKLSKDIVELTGFMYVDDMDLIRVLPGNEHEQIKEELQLAIDYWNKLVKVTGGALAPEKSQWYAYYHTWNEEMGEYQIQDIQDQTLSAKDKDGVRRNLTFLTHETPQEMLGVFMSPDGSTMHQVNTLIEASSKEAPMMERSKLLPHEAKLALTHTILPKLQHPLVPTSITSDQGKKILRPILEPTLQKMGIVKTLGYDYIHGSVETQGLGIPELFHVTYSRQIEFIVNHVWQDSQSSKLIKMAAQELQIELGTAFDLFNANAPERLEEVILTEKSWMQNLRKYMIQHGIYMYLPIPTMEMQRKEDQSIMDILASTDPKQFSKKELRDFNRCRIYKRAQLLSDIADTDGVKIAKRAWNREQWQRNNQDEFNVQHMPNETQWKAWKKGLKLLSTNEGRLIHSVGEWQNKNTQQNKWDFFIDANSKHLYLAEKKTWKKFEYAGRRWRSPYQFHKRPKRSSSSQPEGRLIPVTIIEKDGKYEVEGLNSVQDEGRHEQNTEEVEEVRNSWHCQSLSKSIQKKAMEKYPDTSWALGTIEEVGNMHRVLEDFKQGKSLFVGDGSYKDHKGAGSFVVATQDGEHYIVCSGPTPGPKSSQSPYRSELGTILGCAILAATLETITGTSPMITLICDNENALRRTLVPKSSLKTTHSDSDLISTAQGIWATTKIEVQIRDVKGHADDHKQLEDLTLDERLNSIVDLRAKEERTQITCFPVYRHHHNNEGFIQVKIGDVEITDNIANSIQSILARLRSKKAGIRLQRFTEETYQMIDHIALGNAMRAMPMAKQIFVTKWISKQLPVGKNLLLRKQRFHNQCPFCRAEEDTSHLWECSHEEAVGNFEIALHDFEQGLERIKTHPGIQFHLIAILRQWRTTQNVTPTAFPSSIMNKSQFAPFAEQQKIGWAQFMEGLISSKWSQLQDQYKDKLEYMTGETWAKRVIQMIWKMNFDIWTKRNLKLHESEGILEELEGGEELRKAMIQEFELGPQNIHIELHQLFQGNIEELLQKPIDTKKKWFQIVRTAKEALGHHRSDEFAKNGPLRKWIGLNRL